MARLRVTIVSQRGEGQVLRGLVLSLGFPSTQPVSLHPEPALSHLLALSANCHSNGVREKESERPNTRGETPVSPHCI